MQQHSFDRTGEKAAGASVAYDFGYAFSDIGLSGLSVGAWYIGCHRPPDDARQGLRFRVQYADLWQQAPRAAYSRNSVSSLTTPCYLRPLIVKFEVAAVGRESSKKCGLALLNTGGGNPNWVATTPRV